VNYFRLFIMIASIAGLMSLAHADPGPRSEKEARAIDYNAYQNMKKAVSSFGGIVQKSKGSRREPAYLLRFVQMVQETAAIEYRLAYGRTKKGTAADLTEYKSMMKSSLTALDRLIVAYPNYMNISQAYRFRARALTELGQMNEAISDLKYFVGHWPTSPDAGIVNVDLWTALIQNKSYVDAIYYIKRYGLRPNDQYYNTALEKLAWCSYFLGSIEEAVAYTETEFKTARKNDREKALSNLPLFYATGIEKKYPGITTAAALPRFQKSVSGEELGKLVVSLGYLLRSKGLDSDLETLRTAIETASIPDTSRSEFLLLVFENEQNREQYAAMKVTADQEIALYTKSSVLQKSSHHIDKVHASFMSGAQALQQVFTKEGEAADPTLAATLVTVYSFILKTTKDDVLQQAKIHFNMAEVSYKLKDIEGATGHYRWAVDHLNFKKASEKELYNLAYRRALDTRYEVLKANKWIPQELAALPLSTAHKDVPKQISEWISWVDQFPSASYIAEKMDSLAFESNRILYSFNHVDDSVKRMTAFIKSYPTSKSAIPSASLIIDTYIASQNWIDTFKIASGFLQVPALQATEFHTHLTDVVADSYCKILDSFYRDKKYAAALKGADDFIAKNPASKRKADMLELAANASLGLGDKVKAVAYFDQLNQLGDKKPEIVNLSLMTNGSLAEEHFDFKDASGQYRRYLENGGAASPDLKSKTLLFAWLSGDAVVLSQALASPLLCGAKPDPDCSIYRRRDTDDTPLNKVARAKTISAKIALLNDIPNQWDHENSLGKYTLLSKISDRVPEVFHALRNQIKTEFRIKLDQKTISRRVHWIEEAEKVAANLAKQPWSRVRLSAYIETAGLYHDMIADLKNMKLPKGLSPEDQAEYQKTIADAIAPFQQKSDDLQKVAVEYASTSGCDEATLNQMAIEFHLAYTPHSQKDAFGPAMMALVKPGKSDTSKDLVKEFQAAIDHSNWPKAGFLIQWAQTNKDKAELSPANLSIMKAILLSRTAAIADAASELQSSIKNYNSDEKKQVDVAIESSTFPAQRAPAAATSLPMPSASPSNSTSNSQANPSGGSK
jgi:tetratricopeptide (TPR) repeat protein